VAVTRAFGDLRHRVIIPEPEIREIDLRGDELFLVLACDGLWDVMNSIQVREFVEKYVRSNKKSTKGISEALVNHALQLGSTDNVSVIFIEFFGWVKQ
jgi:serine/threonine protein phosphatase PrpC